MSSEHTSPLSLMETPEDMEQDPIPTLTSSQKADNATTSLRDRLANLAARLTLAINQEQPDTVKAHIRNQISEAKADLEILEAVQAKFQPSTVANPQPMVAKTIVPKDLPLLQWTGNVWNDKRTVF